MRSDGDSLPKPENPYRSHLVVILVLWLSGLLPLMLYGGPSPTNILPFLAGIMLLTLAFILTFGLLAGHLGFRKRFSENQLLAYWEIEGEDWKKFSRQQKTKVLRRGILAGLAFTIIGVGAILTLAFFDDQLDEILHLATLVGALIFAAIAVVIMMQLLPLDGKVGKVWLARKGVLSSGTLFFADAPGIYNINCGIDAAASLSICSVKYQIRSRRTVVDRELLVPVPAEYAVLVDQTIAGWNQPVARKAGKSRLVSTGNKQ